MATFKQTIEGMKAMEQPENQQPQKTNPVTYYKPLSKEEGEDMRKKGMTEDEYRYKQASDRAILMGEQIPDKNEYMKGLAAKREAMQNQPKADKKSLFDEYQLATPEDMREKATRIWNEYLKYATADQTPENIEKGNQLAEDFGAVVYPYLNPKQQDEFDTISGTFKDPNELWDYTKNALGWKDEQPKPKAQEQDYPYDESVLEGITRDTPEKAKKLAQAIYAYRVTKDMDLAGKLFDEYLGK